MQRLGESREAIYTHLEDDCRWIRADDGYKHPEGAPCFNPAWNKERGTLSAEGCFAQVEDISELDAYPWPNPEYLDFSEIYEAIDKNQDCDTGINVSQSLFLRVC